MPKESIDILDYIFTKLAFKVEFKEKRPQCADCPHIKEFTSDWWIYNEIIKKDFCPLCLKYEEAKKNAGD